MRAKLSKAFDMRYWWIKDRIKQKMFNLIWAAGKQNAADYFTKHHPPWHHKKMRRTYLQNVTYHVTRLIAQYSTYANSVGGCVTPVTSSHPSMRAAHNSFPHTYPRLVPTHTNMAVGHSIQT